MKSYNAQMQELVNHLGTLQEEYSDLNREKSRIEGKVNRKNEAIISVNADMVDLQIKFGMKNLIKNLNKAEELNLTPPNQKNAETKG